MPQLSAAPGRGAHRAVARVAVDIALPHLDRLFDYAVPPDLDEPAQPGVRVRVRFAGRMLDGFVVERGAETDPTRTLAMIEKVVSPERVLAPQVSTLVRTVADHYAGCFADVVRLAVPPRHATTEKAARVQRPVARAWTGGASPLRHYPTGDAWLAALQRGDSPRAAWQVVPSVSEAGDWPRGLAVAAAATVASGRGALLVVPDVRDLTRLAAACDEVLGRRSYSVLSAETGPAARYRAFLTGLRGDVKVLIGTRAAAYAPVPDLGLVAMWDDGDDLHADPRAPYPHVREILALRAAGERTALLVAAHARTAEVQHLIDRKWLNPLALTPGEQRRLTPRVRLAGDSDRALERDPMARVVRMPHEVFNVIRTGLAHGPVLVQVPRAGYLVVLLCADCREPIRCPKCAGPVRAGSATAACDWCKTPLHRWSCPNCQGTRWRAPVVGAMRTAEELGRAFPGTPILQSQQDRVIEHVGPEPALVIATPAAEPLAEGGYAAAVLLDAEQLLSRADLRAGEEALRRWLTVVGGVRPGEQGGTVIAVGPTQSAVLQALVRMDPAGFAARELAERAATHLPPAAKMILIEGPMSALTELNAQLEAPDLTEIIGPMETGKVLDNGPLGSLTLRAPLICAHDLVRAVKTAMAVRSARKLPGPLRVTVDP